eukprot:11844463-Karenia_brevis.AAC.1
MSHAGKGSKHEKPGHDSPSGGDDGDQQEDGDDGKDHEDPGFAADALTEDGLCETCETKPCFCPLVARKFKDYEVAYWHGPGGRRHFWPRLRRDDAGTMYLGCALCSSYSRGKPYHPRNKVAICGFVVKPGKLSRGTLKDHVGTHDPAKSDHARCLANFWEDAEQELLTEEKGGSSSTQ